MNRFIACALIGLLGVSQPLANDTVVEIGAGGLEYVQSQNIEMVREDLYISLDEVRVDYVFRNHSQADITAMVAFPMPDITADPYEDVGVPFHNEDNFMGFSVNVDGTMIQPALQQRASVIGIDITRDLVKRGIPLLNTGSAVVEALSNLDASDRAALVQNGAVLVEQYDVGNGQEIFLSPIWTLSSAYYWEMVFPAGQEIRVSHTYTPAVGATTGLSMQTYDGDGLHASEDYVERYCVDDGFLRAAQNRLDDDVQLFENWISYILTTGQNWYRTIGTFHLTIDKGATANLVSFCGEGVTKTGPTTFELTYQDYYPERDLEILILRAMDNF